MKIINLKRVLGSLPLVFAVASCSIQAELISLDGFADALKHRNDRISETPKTHSELSLINIADDILRCSRVDYAAPTGRNPIQILSDCKHNIVAGDVMPGLPTLQPDLFSDSSTFAFSVNRDAKIFSNQHR